MNTSALLTDFYELTMVQGYYLTDKNPQVVFDMFFRRPPYNGGFTVFAGLSDLVDMLESIEFSQEDLEYLDSLKIFQPSFLDYLQNFRFSGDLYAIDEGAVVFPGEPLIRVHTSLIEAQIIESLLLNTINFQTLIATKAARTYCASRGGTILEFGLRRAQGIDGAISAARAAFIGGAAATSNTLAGKIFDIPVKGTMAHSWVMAFDSDEDAFQAYSDIYPDGSIFLIDTYDTLGSGIEGAIAIGRQMKKKGKNFGVRLDSGDLQYLSKQIRRRLDEAGLKDAFITASNELNEEIVYQLYSNGAPIDVWGVGTDLVTGGSDSSLTGVYKMAAKAENGKPVPTIKVSNNPEKTTNPGIKQVYRFFDADDTPLADLMTLEDEVPPKGGPVTFYHPMYEYKKVTLFEYDRCTPLLHSKMEKGKRSYPHKTLRELQQEAITEVDHIDETYKRIINPHIYKVSLSEKLKELKFSMVKSLT
ncbi:MAG: nicotinate phosphoribosyltransferase [Spirochaetales bacterium]|nr:nicotinate phosphoribosyltransferase [Spirochaetales bacterium]MCF7937836.1 nicotinate phosphoribosyltransferase [Spirochaetales bacterium]